MASREFRILLSTILSIFVPVCCARIHAHVTHLKSKMLPVRKASIEMTTITRCLLFIDQITRQTGFGPAMLRQYFSAIRCTAGNYISEQIISFVAHYRTPNFDLHCDPIKNNVKFLFKMYKNNNKTTTTFLRLQDVFIYSQT